MTFEYPGAFEHPGAGLGALLEAVREQVAMRIAAMSADDPTAQDPLRGLYVSPEAADWLLHRPGPTDSPVPDPVDTGTTAELEALAERFGLSALDRQLLLVTLAPDVDRRFGPLYGYLNDDVGRRRATAALALDLCGRSTLDAEARDRLSPGAPLTAGRLILVEHPERPFLERELRVPDRITGHLLGGGAPNPAALPDGAGFLDPHRGDPEADADPRLTGALRSAPERTVHLRGRRADDGVEAARRAAAALGRPVLSLDPSRAGDEPGPALERCRREALISGAVLLVGPLPENGEARWARLLTERPTLHGTAVPTVLHGTAPFDPAWSDGHVLALAAGGEARGGLDDWTAGLNGAVPEGLDLAAETGVYRMSAEQVRRAARTALDLAGADGAPLAPAHLHEAARLQNATGLEKYARRIRPAVDLEDLVLPRDPMRRIEELVHRARHREQVLQGWGMRRGGGRGSGVVSVFAGESGTGKTMAAEVVAGALGLDLYVVELSSVVDKYIGETEKNLDRIFSQADAVNAVLLFDEADAVFGKRSEVNSSHDRYANMESAFLLQRLESFDGVAVLTTNLRGNIDEAFTRRFDVVVDFPFPDEKQRQSLWEHCLRPPLPVGDDVDPALLAANFELAGGGIRAAAVTAAYLAAAAGRPVGAAEVLEGARREYAKAGRLVPGQGAGSVGSLERLLPFD